MDGAHGTAEGRAAARRWAGGWAPRLLALAALGCWTRLTVWPQVFVAGEVLPRYPDTYYHLRQILRAVESFPRVPVRDPLLDWPAGGFSVWPPGFDWMGAALALALGGGGDERRAAAAAAFLPVLLGLVAIGLVVWTARRLAGGGRSGDAVGFAAGALFAVLPNAVVVSRLGRVDHHVAESVAMAGLGAWVLWAAERPAATTRRARGAFELVGAGLAFWAGAVFSGSPLYVAVAAALLVALWLWTPPGDGRVPWIGSGGPGLGLAALALLALDAPAVAVHGHPFDFKFPSHLQPALIALAALGCVGAAALSRVAAHEVRALPRLAQRAAAGGAALAVVGAALVGVAPELMRQVALGLTEFVGRGDPWLASIGEFHPLFPSWALWRPSSWDAVARIHGAAGLLAPLLLPLGLAAAVRRHRPSGLCFAGWTLALLVLGLVQARFARLLTVNLAVCAALAGAWAAAWIARRSGPRVAFGLGGALLALWLAVDPVTRAALVWHAPREPSALEAASLYLRRHASVPPRAGVLAPWEWGNTIVSLARLPVVSAGFGPYVGAEGFREVQAALHGGEPELLALMERRRLRWLASGSAAFDGRVEPQRSPFVRDAAGLPAGLDLGYFRDVALAPLMIGGGGDPLHDVPHLGRLRPRFASTQTVGSLPVARLWVYERVAGATLVGRVEPGARVAARLPLFVDDRAVPWTAWADADDEGRYRIVVPLPTSLDDPPVRTGAAYDLRVAGASIARVAVSEAEVREGARVAAEAPDRSVLAARHHHQ